MKTRYRSRRKTGRRPYCSTWYKGQRAHRKYRQACNNRRKLGWGSHRADHWARVSDRWYARWTFDKPAEASTP